VLVLEPSYGRHGAVKTARKGVGDYLVKVTGRASHAGLDFEKGANAIIELARQIEKISAFTDSEKESDGQRRHRERRIANQRGSGGSDCAGRCSHRRMRDAAGIDKKMRSLRSFNPNAKSEVSGGINRRRWNGLQEWQPYTLRLGDRTRIGMEAWRSRGGEAVSDGNLPRVGDSHARRPGRRWRTERTRHTSTS